MTNHLMGESFKCSAQCVNEQFKFQSKKQLKIVAIFQYVDLTNPLIKMIEQVF